MALTQEQVRSLDSLRQRLASLADSLTAARVSLERSDPVPKWDDLQSSAQMIARNIEQANHVLNANRHFFTQAHAYPLPNFPGQREEGMLELLLRKRLEPRVEDWLGEHTKPKDEVQVRSNGVGKKRSENSLSKEELRELWSWAGPASNRIVRELLDDGQFDEDFTLEEQESGVENVTTGLKRDLVGADDDDDGDKDQADKQGDHDTKMDDASPERPKPAPEEVNWDPSLPPMALETLLKYMSTGALPRSNDNSGLQGYRR